MIVGAGHGLGWNWLGGRDSNPDSQIQSLESYHWTTSQQRNRIYKRHAAKVKPTIQHTESAVAAQFLANLWACDPTESEKVLAPQRDNQQNDLVAASLICRLFTVVDSKESMLINEPNRIAPEC